MTETAFYAEDLFKSLIQPGNAFPEEQKILDCRRQAEADIIIAAQGGNMAAIRALTKIIEDTTLMLSMMFPPTTPASGGASVSPFPPASPASSSPSLTNLDDKEQPQQEPIVAAAGVTGEYYVSPTSPRSPGVLPVDKDAIKQSQKAVLNSLTSDTRTLVEGPPEIPSSEIELGTKIGGGAFGAVYLGRVRGKLVAVKVPNRQELNDEKRAAFMREVAMMKTIFHQNVVLFLGACVEPGKLMVVTELMSCDLDKIIHGNGCNAHSLSLKEKLLIAQDVALGVNWLHGICHIIHRDLKPANILVDENMHAKVTDFGFSEFLRDGDRHTDSVGANGTMLYMAPEVMRFEEFDNSVDIYAFGLILYEMITEQELFPEYEEVDAFINAVAYNHKRPSLNLPGIPTSILSLIKRCWHPNPRNRPKCPEVIDMLDKAIIDATAPPPPPLPITGFRGEEESFYTPTVNSAAEFWKQYFVHPFLEEIPWAVIEGIICDRLTVAPITLERFKINITKTSGGPLRGVQRTVSLTDFNMYYQWFGHFFDMPDGTRYLREMNRVLAAPWFHGDITQEEAESRLMMSKGNTFLVRFSHKNPYLQPFTISRLKNGSPAHKRINRTIMPSQNGTGGIQCFTTPMSDGTFRNAPTVTDLITLLQREGNLITPCPKRNPAAADSTYSTYST